jgi:hypothetical protein
MKQEFIKAILDFLGLILLGAGAYNLITYLILNF